MTYPPPTNWSLFRMLCRVLGGQDNHVLADSVAADLFPQLVDMAETQEVLPALAVRCDEQRADGHSLDGPEIACPENERLRQALRNNTLRNMHISAQALKLCKILNVAGIVPVFLKGTAQLLGTNMPNLGFRKQLDIDVLVQPTQLDAAVEVLLEDGYRFYESSTGSLHHHLPELEKDDCVAMVELHRHFLSKRFQHRNSLEPLFSTAVSKESHGARFLVPSTEYQIIHLVLGRMVNDGHMARRTFPLREACDYIHFQETAKGGIDYTLVAKHCGKNYLRYAKLVAELMAYPPAEPMPGQIGIDARLQTMQKRFNLSTVRAVLDAYARSLHLTQAVIFSPEKLPAYLSRRGNG